LSGNRFSLSTQAIGRIHRYGQVKTAKIVHLLTHETKDVPIYANMNDLAEDDVRGLIAKRKEIVPPKRERTGEYICRTKKESKKKASPKKQKKAASDDEAEEEDDDADEDDSDPDSDNSPIARSAPPTSRSPLAGVGRRPSRSSFRTKRVRAKCRPKAAKKRSRSSRTMKRVARTNGRRR
jgi:hypothetical protein